jgi:hypothetical protein
MALQIAQFVANHNLTGLPANRILLLGNNTSVRMVLPNNKNVLIKKIAVDCIYNQQSAIVILDYCINVNFRFFDLQLIQPNRFTVINSTAFGSNVISIQLNKQNPIINLNTIAGSFDLSATGSNNFVSLGLGGTVNSNISFLITVYYENIIN